MVSKKVLQAAAMWLAKHPVWMIAGAIVYFLSPFDLWPEALLGPVGYFDDILVLLLPLVIREYAKRLQKKPDVYDTTLEP